MLGVVINDPFAWGGGLSFCEVFRTQIDIPAKYSKTKLSHSICLCFSDTICELGGASELANYGEYSGAPTESQTYQYAITILKLLSDGEPRPDGEFSQIHRNSNANPLSRRFWGAFCQASK